MNLDAALQTYIVESREMLEEMEDILLRIEQEDDRTESLNAIFRAAHTIKGSAGLFGLDYIVTFTHGLETLLDQLRDGLINLDENLTALFLSCGDHISDLIDFIETDSDTLSEPLKTRGDELTQQLQQHDVTRTPEKPEDSTALPQVSDDSSHVEREHCDQVESDNWHISLRFGLDSLRDGMDPLSFLRYLSTLGDIIAISTLDDALPVPQEMDAESCYLGFEINFDSAADKQTIENVFEFIREDSLIRIFPPKSELDSYIQHIEALPEEDLKLGEILVSSGSLTQSELDRALNTQQSPEAETSQPIGNIVVESGMTSQTVLDAAVKKQTKIREVKNRESASVRVDAEKLDELINLIGELVIASAGTALDAQTNGDGTLIESVSTLSHLIEEVRDSTLNLRMVQIGATFHRFQRVVREVSKDLGKEINLVINGADTELDKTVVEKIGDPLMHLVRNSIDHGIETPDVRMANNKPAAGTVSLNAFHDSGSIVIEISDDGAGLNRDKILNKAIEKGLISAEHQLEDSEIYGLIFEPGFSTVDQVSNLSGRGVGMDVVKRNITALRGTVDVESQPGEGSIFRIRMPLTLAIIDGFLVGVDDSSFVVPLDMVLECVELNEANQKVSADRDYINLRGEVLPFIRLRDLFSVGGSPPRRENIVVVHAGGNKSGLVVDRLMGEFQTVIKPLGEIFSEVQGVGGSTILGNGEVALILDIPSLINTVSSNDNRAVGLGA